MQTVSMRDLQHKGVAALEGAPDITLVEGAKASFFLVPVRKGFEDLQAGLLERALAKAWLFQSQLHAVSSGLGSMTMDEINEEVRAVRKSRVERRKANS